MRGMRALVVSLSIGLSLFFGDRVSQAQSMAPLEEARASLFRLTQWKFQTDPRAVGVSERWMSPAFDDSKWPALSTDRNWESQGYPGYDGYAWYRVSLTIPSHWSGSEILLQSDGIDDQYDVYVNGKYIRHFGENGELSVWQSPTQTELSRYLEYGKTNVIALRVLDNGGPGGIWRRIQLRRVPPFERYSYLLPTPILDSRPEWVQLYWSVWKMAWAKLSFGDTENGFVHAYMDEGYNEHIYQWDSIFMTMFGRYGAGLFPAMETLDNFYRKQDPNGYISRIYSETTGSKIQEPIPESPQTNPPLFAWAEWEYYRLTGDKSRFARVLPILERYDKWFKENQRTPYGRGLYYMTGFDSGMDNMPRPNAEFAGWVDTSLQQTLAAKYMALMARHLGDTAKENHWKQEYLERRDLVNQLCWNDADGIYYDVDRDGHHTGVRHIGAFWSLLSYVATPVQASRLVGHLRNPNEFYRPHMFPALSASDAGFSKTASYWRGGVWAPTNYMTIRGLMAYGYEDFAREAALNHLSNMAKVYASTVDPSHVDPNEADDDFHTVWECYNPDRPVPCTRADAYYYGRQDFVGWTGLGPIALLIEQAIGVDAIGPENKIVWRLQEPGRVGIANLNFGQGNRITLIADAVKSSGRRRISTQALKPFKLQVKAGARIQEIDVPAGTRAFNLAF